MRMQDGSKIAKNKLKIDRVSQIIIVASGKGGVGKSTIAVAMAQQLAYQGARVGLVDADIYGPSIPTMLGIDSKPELNGTKMIPLTSAGIKVMSIGFLVKPGSSIAWRGPMATKAIYQILSAVDWGGLDYLIIDTPPGTSDIHLSILENYHIDNVVMVTTPQKLAAIDVIKAIDLYRKFSAPILGIIENMSDIFPGNSAEEISKEYNIPLIAKIPMSKEISIAADNAMEIGSLLPMIIA